MKLTEKDYQKLKGDEWILTSIIMLRDVMEDSQQERSEHIKQRKVRYKQDIDQAIKLLDKLINNDLLLERLKLNNELLKIELERLKDFRKYHLNSRRKKVGPQNDRDFWIESICVRLYDLKITQQSRRVDFIYRLFFEYDFDGCFSAINSDKTSDKILDKFDEANMRRSFRHIDKKAIDEYINY